MPEPSLYQNKGPGYAGAGHSRNSPKRALLGQKTEFGIRGKGICSVRSRN